MACQAGPRPERSFFDNRSAAKNKAPDSLAAADALQEWHGQNQAEAR